MDHRDNIGETELVYCSVLLHFRRISKYSTGSILEVVVNYTGLNVTTILENTCSIPDQWPFRVAGTGNASGGKVFIVGTNICVGCVLGGEHRRSPASSGCFLPPGDLSPDLNPHYGGNHGHPDDLEGN